MKFISRANGNLAQLGLVIIYALLTTSCSTPKPFHAGFAFANQVRTNSARTIIICMDGTWNTEKDETNVRQIYLLSKPREGSLFGDKVIPYYDKGVGATKMQKYPGGGTGHGYQKNVAQAHRFLCMTWKPGDKIVIVGFSRGAYQARLLAGMIDWFGIYYDDRSAALTNDNAILNDKTSKLVDIFRLNSDVAAARKAAVDKELWSDSSWNDGKSPAAGWRKAEVEALCVFDTVSTILSIGNKLGKEGIAPPPHAGKLFGTTILALHALSIDEVRDKFELVPFRVSEPQNRLQQVWFVGGHSDIGGGNKCKGLSSITLHWVLTNLAANCGAILSGQQRAASGCASAQITIAEAKGLYKYSSRPEVSPSSIHPTVTNRIDAVMGYKPQVSWWDTTSNLKGITSPRD